MGLPNHGPKAPASRHLGSHNLCRTIRPLFPSSSHPVSSTLAFLAAAAAGCLASAASALLHGVASPPPRLLLPGSVFTASGDITLSAATAQMTLLLGAVPALDHLAAALPRSFTPGEAIILLQALMTLAAGGLSYLLAAVRAGAAHVLWCTHMAQPDPGMHVPAFVVMVLFWSLAGAGCMALLAAPECIASKDAVPDVVKCRTHAKPLEAAASTNGRNNGTAASGLVHRGRRDGRQASPRDLLLWRQNALRFGAATGVAVCLVMLGDLALWVLGRFVAAASRPRLATLAYWFGCLAVAVPLMALMSKASAAREREAQVRQTDGEAVARPVGEDKVQASGAARKERGGERDYEERRVGDPGSRAEACSWVLVERETDGDGRLSAAGDEERSAQRAEQQQGEHSGSATAAAVGGLRLRREEAGARSAGADGSVHKGTRSGGTLGRPAEDRHAGRGMGGGSDHAAGPGPPAANSERSSCIAPAASLTTAALRILAVPHIVMRKGYHLLAIALFAPAFVWDARMLAASLAVAGAVLVLGEVLRVAGPKHVRAAIGAFMADFADARDSGPVYVTHFTLLLGIAVPVWLSDPVCGAAAGAMMAGLYGPEAAVPLPPRPAAVAGTDPPPVLSAAAAALLPRCRTVVGLSGLVALGSGDTAAACVGFLLGQRRLFRGGRKTWEGTLSGAAAMLASWAAVAAAVDMRWALGWREWGALAGCTAGVALLEAVTSQLDNVVVPLYYAAHLVLGMTGN